MYHKIRMYISIVDWMEAPAEIWPVYFEDYRVSTFRNLSEDECGVSVDVVCVNLQGDTIVKHTAQSSLLAYDLLVDGMTGELKDG